MPRYIDAEELLKHKRKVMVFGISCEDDSWDYAVLEEDIINVPTADVVEVVRCKDCKYCKVINNSDVYAICLKKCFAFEPFETDIRTHYCSNGVRKDG